jgi:anhydro-N-acetylmuramic acid kinase
MAEQNPRLFAGAMSGTSADGVDIAITRIAGRGAQMTAALVHHHHAAYESSIRSMIFSIRESGSATLEDLGKLARQISLTYAQAVKEALAASGLQPKSLSAIAAHGQTLYHQPPNTIQWLDPALLASEVGCTVVSDFRRADCAAGGEGAPLVPFADYVLFRHSLIDRILLNIGGIANLTFIPAGADLSDIKAFDTGPGNCISDWLSREHQKSPLDEGGALAMSGTPDQRIAQAFLNDAYFQRPPPKSTDGPAMIAAFKAVAGAPQHASALKDQFATACLITALSIVRGIQIVTAEQSFKGEVIVSGGGTRNACVLFHLQRQLPALLRRPDDLGVPSDAKEAVAFALLAAATLDGVPSSVPSVTGAARPVILGSITPAP